MRNVFAYTRPDGVTVIERLPPKTAESKAAVDAARKDCIASLRLRPMPETDRLNAIKEMQVEQGKAAITNGLRMIAIGSSPEAAIAHLRSELAAIDPGTEF